MARREGGRPPRAGKNTVAEPETGDVGSQRPEGEVSEVTAEQPTKRPPGRPPGSRREVAARFTVRLDGSRYDALSQLADSEGRSLHSLMLEAIDDLMRKRGGVGLS
ncbi:hypothetical protein MGN01_43830 [Methylobacterium gnaphalii]|uniref:Uncharacterized protein n=1 Tax=Methylobacterium gnaphalii TaxID=1010610 RepID=A0A512JRE8_9HYPH|nr:hypothetical protein MGN01_43830 [Methylobacterium gnaphalii]GLS51524.1 hypothetical protein GCM10007885_43820 [Methylobacterium gnaphalii]